MRLFDLLSAGAKLDMAMQTLDAIRSETWLYWNDNTRLKFDETYFGPLEPRVKGTLEAVRHLTEILRNAQRECGED